MRFTRLRSAAAAAFLLVASSAGAQVVQKITNGGTGATSPAGARANLDLEPGTDIQAYDADLAAIAALTTDSFGLGLLELANGAAVRSYIGAGVGSHVHAWADITSGLPTTLAGFGITDASPLFTDSAGLRGLLGDALGTGGALFNSAPSPTFTGTVDGASLKLSSLTSGRVPRATTAGLLTDTADFQHDGTRLALGVVTPSSSVRRLEVRDLANAVTSGFNFLQYDNLVMDPAGASSAINYGIRSDVETKSTNTQNFSGSGTSFRGQYVHRGSGVYSGDLQGAHFLAAVGAESGAAANAGTLSGNAFGVLTTAWANGTNSGTIANGVFGSQFDARNRSPGTVSLLVGSEIGIGSENGGSGAGTITQAYGARISGRLSGFNILTAGTITNGTMLEIGAWPTNPTYTNPPVGIDILAQPVTNAVALRINAGFTEISEYDTTTDASAPADNRARLYVRDNGAGKEQIVARFNTGAVQVIATEP